LDADSKVILDSLDLSSFNVIDVDCFGIDFDLYKRILESKQLKKPVRIIYTLVSHQLVGMHKSGIEMFCLHNIYNKCKGMFNAKTVEYFYQLLANYGVKEVKYYENRGKFYIQYGYFVLE